MGVVLCETAHTHQSVQSAGKLMPMDKAQFRQALRQITVGMQLSLVNQHPAGAVHGFDCIVCSVDFCGVHIVFVMIPMPGTVPQFFTQNNRGADFLIAVLGVFLTPEVFKLVAQNHALRKKERETRSLFIDVEQVKFTAQLAVVAFFCLVKHMQIIFQF